MKKIWIAVILLVVIAGIAGLLIYLNKEEPFKQDATLYSYKDRAVEEIHIDSGNGKVSFVKKQNEWFMVEPKQYKADAGTAGILENRLKDFLASRVLDEKPDDLKRYGLDAPTATISFKLDDGTENTLLIGGMTASKVQYYAKDTKRDLIYILGSYDVENFVRPVNDFRDRTLLVIDSASINTVSLDTADKREFKLTGDEAGKWRFSEPLESDTKGDAVTEMLGDIGKLVIKDFVTGNEGEIGRFGLEKPAYTLEIGDSKQKTQKIYFGKIDEEKQVVYIKADGSEEVYTVSLEVFDPRRYKIADLLNVAPLSVSIENMSKATIIEGSSVTEFLKDTSKGEGVFTCGGKTVSKEDFTTLYINIMALTAEGYDPQNKGGTPELTVILELKDKSQTIKAEFVKRDDMTYYFILNGEPKPFFIGERKIDLIKRWRDRVLESMNKT